MRDEVVNRLHVTGSDGFGHHTGGLGFGLGRSFTRFCFQKGRLALAFGLKDLPLLFTFGGQNCRRAQAFGFKDLRTLDTFGLHLPRHGRHQIGRRADVFDFDPGDLDPPRRGGVIDGFQQFLVDRVTLAEHGVQFHRAEYGTNIGHHQVADGVFEVVHLIRGLRGIDDLKEADGINLHGGVVGGNHFLRRNIQHAFHYVELAPDPVHHRHNNVQARFQGVGVATEALHGPLEALRYDLKAHK